MPSHYSGSFCYNLYAMDPDNNIVFSFSVCACPSVLRHLVEEVYTNSNMVLTSMLSQLRRHAKGKK